MTLAKSCRESARNLQPTLRNSSRRGSRTVLCHHHHLDVDHVPPRAVHASGREAFTVQGQPSWRLKGPGLRHRMEGEESDRPSEARVPSRASLDPGGRRPCPRRHGRSTRIRWACHAQAESAPSPLGQRPTDAVRAAPPQCPRMLLRCGFVSAPVTDADAVATARPPPCPQVTPKCVLGVRAEEVAASGERRARRRDDP